MHFYVVFSNNCTYSTVKQVVLFNKLGCLYIWHVGNVPWLFLSLSLGGGLTVHSFGLKLQCRPAAVALDKLAHRTFHLNLIVSPSDSRASYGPV